MKSGSGAGDLGAGQAQRATGGGLVRLDNKGHTAVRVRALQRDGAGRVAVVVKLSPV